MKEMKLEIPADCGVDKIETQDGHIVITLNEKEPKLPRSWEEFCEMFPDYTGEYFIEPNNKDKIGQVLAMDGEKREDRNAELLADRASAEAVLALCKLIQLRNAYNGDWVPDWNNKEQEKYTITIIGNKIETDCVIYCTDILYFKTAELRDEFLRNFRPLIEKLKPLYGIKEGGEEC